MVEHGFPMEILFYIFTTAHSNLESFKYSKCTVRHGTRCWVSEDTGSNASLGYSVLKAPHVFLPCRGGGAYVRQ
jgi:hypothetical protein